jgi:hypothetical protein
MFKKDNGKEEDLNSEQKVSVKLIDKYLKLLETPL